MKYAGDRNSHDRISIKIGSIENTVERLRKVALNPDSTREELIHLTDIIRDDLRYIEVEKK